MHRRFRWTVLAAILGIAAPAEAGFILTTSSTTVPQGGNGAIDLTIKTDGTPTSLGEYGFDIYVNGSSTHNSPALTFVNPTDLSYRNQSNYIFFNNSLGSAVAYSNQSGSAGLHQEVGGGDTINFFTASNDVNVGNSSTFLLAHLNLAASSAARVGDVYTIQVFSNSNPVTSATSYSGVFSSTPPTNFVLPTGGAPTVTIGPAAGVPEPHSMVLMISAMVSLMAYRFLFRGRLGYSSRGTTTLDNRGKSALVQPPVQKSPLAFPK